MGGQHEAQPRETQDAKPSWRRNPSMAFTSVRTVFSEQPSRWAYQAQVLYSASLSSARSNDPCLTFMDSPSWSRE